MSLPVSNTRVCAECLAPKELGVLKCSACGAMEWIWKTDTQVEVDLTNYHALPGDPDWEKE